MTDIGRLRELKTAADAVSDFAANNEPRALYLDALEDADSHLLSEIETLRTQSGSLFDAIQHGDDEHRAWLKAAITAHFAGEPVPPPSGSGRKEAEIETLRARLLDAERVVEAARTHIMLEWETLDLTALSLVRQEREWSWGPIPASEIALADYITAYDQGKVTTCDSAPTEGE